MYKVIQTYYTFILLMVAKMMQQFRDSLAFTSFDSEDKGAAL